MLPDVPAGLAQCTADAVPAIPGARGTGLTKAQSAEALADQRAAALAAHRCSVAWREFYDDLRGSLSRAGSKT